MKSIACVGLPEEDKVDIGVVVGQLRGDPQVVGEFNILTQLLYLSTIEVKKDRRTIKSFLTTDLIQHNIDQVPLPCCLTTALLLNLIF